MLPVLATEAFSPHPLLRVRHHRYPQRLQRDVYLERLQRSLEIAKASDPPPDADEYWERSVIRCERWFYLAHAMRAAADSSRYDAEGDQRDKATSKHGGSADSVLACLPLELPGDFGIRDAQFVHKMKRVNGTIDLCEARRVDALSRRADFTTQLRRLQHRIVAVNAELVRVTVFRGEYFSSSVMHGADQRFETAVLKQELEKELAAAGAAVAEIKQSLIADDKTRM